MTTTRSRSPWVSLCTLCEHDAQEVRLGAPACRRHAKAVEALVLRARLRLSYGATGDVSDTPLWPGRQARDGG